MNYDKSAVYSIPALTTRKGDPYALGDRGFTLVELLLVMAILGILALLAIPTYDKVKDRAREVRAMGEIRGLEKSITAYAIDHGNLPTLLQLQGVVAPSVLVDPWGNNYVYINIVNDGPERRYVLDPLNDDFDLYSKGRDGLSVPDITDTSVSLDDIVRAGDGAYVGLGKNY